MNICIIGTGYVGLATGACFAELGNHVICIDHDMEKINSLSKGEALIYEPSLGEMVTANQRKGRLLFTHNLKSGLAASEIIFVTVDTPSNEDGSTNITNVQNVVKSIGILSNSDKLIVLKSTVPVGTSAKMKSLLSHMKMERQIASNFEVVSNPEFLKEGSAVKDFLHPERIIIGADNVPAIQMMKLLYKPISDPEKCPVIIMNPTSAEMTKYAANSMLAVRISFINELAKLCDLSGADIADVENGIGSDSRIGRSFLKAGLGYGGSCFPKDIRSLITTLSEHGLNSKLWAAVEEINKNQRQYFISKIREHFHNELAGKIMAVWGLTFKPDTDDLREAPSFAIIKELLSDQAIIRAFDPQARRPSVTDQEMGNPNLWYCNDPYEALFDADGLILVTEWDCFRDPDFGKMKRLMRQTVIFDGRNVYEPAKIRNFGFDYYGIGRG